MDNKELEDLLNKLGETDIVDALQKLRDNVNGINQSVQKMKLKQFETRFEDLKDSIKDGTGVIQSTYDELGAMAKQIKQNTSLSADEKEAKLKDIAVQQKKVMSGMRLNFALSTASEHLVTFGKTLVDIYFMQMEAAMSQVETIQRGTSGIRIATELMNSKIRLAAAETEKMASAAGNFASAFAMLPGLGLALRVAFLALGEVLKFFGMVTQKNAEMQQRANNIMAEGAQQLLDSFKNMTSSGANFAGGMSEFSNIAHKAGVTVKQFGEIVKENKELLSDSGMGVTAATKMLSKTYETMQASQIKQMRNLGYSTEEMYSITSQVMADAGKMGRNLNAEEVGKLTTRYAKDLRLIADITGEDAKKKLAEQRKQMESLAAQAAISDLAKKRGLTDAQTVEFMEAMNTSLTTKGPLFQKSMNSFIANGVVAGDAAVALSQKSTSYQKMFYEAAEAYKRGDIELANKKYDEMAKVDKEITANQRAMSVAGNLFGEFSEANRLLLEERQFQLKLQKQDNKTTSDNVNAAANTNDKLTNTISRIESEAQRLRVILEKKIIGNMDKYADQMEAVLKQQISDLSQFTGAIAGAGAATSLSMDAFFNKLEIMFQKLIDKILKQFPDFSGSGPGTNQMGAGGNVLNTNPGQATQANAALTAAILQLTEKIDPKKFDNRVKVENEMLDKYGEKYGVNFIKRYLARDTALGDIQKGINARGTAEEKAFLANYLKNHQSADSGATQKKAAGGIVDRPSITGEAGPEAVIPLSGGGKVPTTLNLSPLISIMERQLALQEQQLKVQRDMVDAQERLYDVTA